MLPRAGGEGGNHVPFRCAKCELRLALLSIQERWGHCDEAGNTLRPGDVGGCVRSLVRQDVGVSRDPTQLGRITAGKTKQ